MSAPATHSLYPIVLQKVCLCYFKKLKSTNLHFSVCFRDGIRFSVTVAELRFFHRVCGGAGAPSAGRLCYLLGHKTTSHAENDRVLTQTHTHIHAFYLNRHVIEILSGLVHLWAILSLKYC